MDEPEIVKLRKQIQLLNQHNTELKNQIEEQSILIGEMRKKYNQLSTDYQIQSNQNNIIKNKDNIQKLIENSLLEEKQKTNKYKDSNILLSQKINSYDQIIKDKDSYIDKLIKENNNLKKDLIKCSNNKNSSIDYFEQKKNQHEIEKLNIINDSRNIANDFNNLCDQMENVIRENRILRQMADVPENFGIDISKIKLGERVKIEDYKNKIRYLIHNVDELETERAQLKHRIYFLASSFQLNEPPFNLLSKEQKVDLGIYAQKLYEGKVKILEDNNNNKIDELNNEIKEKDIKIDELKRTLEEKNIHIKKLENELESKKVNERFRMNSTDTLRNGTNYNNFRNYRYGEVQEYNNNINNNENDRQISEIINLLKEQKNEFQKYMDNKQNINNRSINNGNVYNIFNYNNNIFLSQNNNGRYNNYLGSEHKIIRRSMGK